MKKRPFILLTGDDSIYAKGLILVKRIVEEFADIQIIATKNQMSAVGASISFGEKEWGKDMVDGVEAIWVDAFPTDAIYFAYDYLGRKPDLVISGVNYGANVENAILPGSGTVAAALRAAHARNTPAIAFSRKTTWKMMQDNPLGTLTDEDMEYPGKFIDQIVRAALDYDFPKYNFWNVNFPLQKATEMKVVKTNEYDYFPNTVTVGDGKFSYDYEAPSRSMPDDTDSGEMTKGFVTITPCKLEYTNFDELEKLKKLF